MLEPIFTIGALAALLFASPTHAMLTPRYDHGGLGTGLHGQVEAEGVWTRYDTIVLLHGICGLVAWQIISPLAVLIAAIGRDWGPVWFRIHWMLQLLMVVPLTVAAVVLGAVANRLGDESKVDRHQVLGFVILGLVWLQVSIGYWSHKQHSTLSEQPKKHPESPALPQRRLAGYLHLLLGVALLALGGPQVTWGVTEYAAKPIATWILILHWVLAGVPVAIIAPYVLIRDMVRLRRGKSFSEAFFNRAPSPRYSPPRKLWLHESRYMEDVEDATGDGEGFVHARGGGVGGSQRLSTANTDELGTTGWDGPSTREEYEEKVLEEAYLGVHEAATSGAPSLYSTADGNGAGEDFSEETSFLPSSSLATRSDTYTTRADTGHSPATTVTPTSFRAPAIPVLPTPPSFPHQPTVPLDYPSATVFTHKTSFVSPPTLLLPPPAPTSSTSAPTLPEIPSIFSSTETSQTSNPQPAPSERFQPTPPLNLPSRPPSGLQISTFDSPSSIAVLLPENTAQSPKTIEGAPGPSRAISQQATVGGSPRRREARREGSDSSLPFPEDPSPIEYAAPSVLSVRIGTASEDELEAEAGSEKVMASEDTFGVQPEKQEEAAVGGRRDSRGSVEGPASPGEASVVSVATGKWMAGAV